MVKHVNDALYEYVKDMQNTLGNRLNVITERLVRCSTTSLRPCSLLPSVTSQAGTLHASMKLLVIRARLIAAGGGDPAAQAFSVEDQQQDWRPDCT